MNKWVKLLLILSILSLFIISLKESPKNVNIGIKEGFVGTCTYSKKQAKKVIKDTKKTAKKELAKCNKCQEDNKSEKCGKKCGALLPVMDPMFNMREMCKQMILLEDHLFQTKKRCHDCICKHFLTIEALAEEAITLDKDHKYQDITGLPDKIRDITKKYIANHENPKQPPITAQDMRKIRKSLMQKCFKHF